VWVRPNTAPTLDGLAVDRTPYPVGLAPPSRRGRSERPIGDVIVDLGFAAREVVEQAIASAQERGEMTGQVLVELGVMRPDQLARALAERLGVDYVDLSKFAIDVGAVNLVEAAVARRYRAVPVGFMPGGAVVLAMADPTNVLALDEMAMITGLSIRPAAAAPEDIAALVARLSHLGESVAEVEEFEPDPEVTIEGPRDAASAITRLIDMHIEPFMLAAAIDCVVAQRLARRLCTHCRRPAELPPRVILEHGLQNANVFEAVGCIRCGHTGYQGRIGLYELMPISDEIRTSVLERGGLDELRAIALAQGMRTIRKDGIDKVKHGLTSLTEILRLSSSL
jgi:hypothetical protein